MSRFQVKCRTIFVVEAANESAAIEAFKEALNDGGFAYTAEKLMKEGVRD